MEAQTSISIHQKASRSDKRQFMGFLTPWRAQHLGNLAEGHMLRFREGVRIPGASC